MESLSNIVTAALLVAGGLCLILFYRVSREKRANGRMSPPQRPSERDDTKVSSAPTISDPTVPLSVNYHFLRSCNYSCGFCFHTATTSHVEPLERALKALQMLREAGCEKINFSGGEPFLHEGGAFLGRMCEVCKTEFRYRSVSIVSNGSLITEEWLATYGSHVDILAISCDSFDDKTNRAIGRVDRRNATVPHAEKLRIISRWCSTHDVRFKINTVVNKHNINEDFTVPLLQLRPFRWKLFQCLEIEGENKGSVAKRKAQPFLVSDEDFHAFVEYHRKQLENSPIAVVPESNRTMRTSYIILDEYLRFLDCAGGSKKPSRCILDVGVKTAMQESGFDADLFFERGGHYPWAKQPNCTDLTW